MAGWRSPLSATSGRAGYRVRLAAIWLVALLALIGLSGCPALIIPSLGYQAYKYEEKHSKKTENQRRDKEHSESNANIE